MRKISRQKRTKKNQLLTQFIPHLRRKRFSFTYSNNTKSKISVLLVRGWGFLATKINSFQTYF